MPHVRRQIIDQLVTTVTGLTTTGANVKASRVYPVQGSELPALVVYATEETVLEDQSTLDIDYRSLSVVIEGYAEGETGADVDDTLDLIASEVETAVLADLDVNALAVSIRLTGTSIEMRGDGDQATASIQIEFTVNYRTTIGAPDTVA